ncbi:MAG: hypothetical protein Q4D02_08280 [Clostridia bacterium]|nr:hypothetical protein [Clostridia bacterium]
MLKKLMILIIVVVIAFLAGAGFTHFIMPKLNLDINNNIENINQNVVENDVSDSDEKSVRNVDWRALYKEVLEEYKEEADSLYALADIDNDGIPELIVRTGSYEAEYMFHFYKCINHKAENIDDGIGAGHTALYLMNNENYIRAIYAHMGYETVSNISIEDNKIKYEQISQREVSTSENYAEGDKLLELYNVNDFTLIEGYLD